MAITIQKETADKLKETDLKAFLFDMDGVLFDSMPHHAKAWVHAFNALGVDFNEYDAYMREGMTGNGTISEIFADRLGREATPDECKRIYAEKSAYFETLGESAPMKDVDNVLNTIKQQGYEIYVVTGSAHKSLIDKLEHTFPGIFDREKMVTAFDVKKGKPDPEPYLMALEKGHYKKNEAIVVENAPLGVKSAHSAGLFTIAVNTGILKDSELTTQGADILFHNMNDLFEALPEIIRHTRK